MARHGVVWPNLTIVLDKYIRFRLDLSISIVRGGWHVIMSLPYSCHTDYVNEDTHATCNIPLQLLS